MGKDEPARSRTPDATGILLGEANPHLQDGDFKIGILAVHLAVLRFFEEDAEFLDQGDEIASISTRPTVTS
ncbi:MAG: hypothetical protein HYY93_03140 [Planctomycetes bacterium]|nr:hypothetical protein [Planctomycetota bacterium]